MNGARAQDNGLGRGRTPRRRLEAAAASVALLLSMLAVGPASAREPAEVDAVLDCDGGITVTATGHAISNIVVRTADGDTKIEEPFESEDDEPDPELFEHSLVEADYGDVTSVFVKAGNNRSGEGPGYGEEVIIVEPDDCGPVLDVCNYREQQRDEGRDLSRPAQLTLVLGDELTTTTSTSQPDGKYVVGPVLGDPGGPTVLVRVTDSSDPSNVSSVYFGGTVDLGSSLVVTAAAAGSQTFGSNVHVHVLATNGALLQSIRIHTSCSAPVVIGDRFGSVTLVGVGLVDTGTGELVVLGV